MRWKTVVVCRTHKCFMQMGLRMNEEPVYSKTEPWEHSVNLQLQSCSIRCVQSCMSTPLETCQVMLAKPISLQASNWCKCCHSSIFGLGNRDTAKAGKGKDEGWLHSVLHGLPKAECHDQEKCFSTTMNWSVAWCPPFCQIFHYPWFGSWILAGGTGRRSQREDCFHHPFWTLSVSYSTLWTLQCTKYLPIKVKG